MALIAYEKLTMGSAGVNIQNEIAWFFLERMENFSPYSNYIVCSLRQNELHFKCRSD